MGFVLFESSYGREELLKDVLTNLCVNKKRRRRKYDCCCKEINRVLCYLGSNNFYNTLCTDCKRNMKQEIHGSSIGYCCVLEWEWVLE